LLSLMFRIVFSWLLLSHVKLWNTPTVTCNSHEPVFCNLDASTDNPTLCVLTLFLWGSMYLPTHSVYNFWSLQRYLQLHKPAMPFISQSHQCWNTFRSYHFLINLGSSSFLLSDVPFGLLTTGPELILAMIQVASAHVATTTFLIYLYTMPGIPITTSGNYSPPFTWHLCTLACSHVSQSVSSFFVTCVLHICTVISIIRNDTKACNVSGLLYACVMSSQVAFTFQESLS
jgi:hypothetical protein